MDLSLSDAIKQLIYEIMPAIAVIDAAPDFYVHRATLVMQLVSAIEAQIHTIKNEETKRDVALILVKAKEQFHLLASGIEWEMCEREIADGRADERKQRAAFSMAAGKLAEDFLAQFEMEMRAAAVDVAVEQMTNTTTGSSSAKCPVEYVAPNEVKIDGEIVTVTNARMSALKVIIDAFPSRVMLEELRGRSGKQDADTYLKELAVSHPSLSKHIKFPENRGRGYGIE